MAFDLYAEVALEGGQAPGRVTRPPAPKPPRQPSLSPEERACAAAVVDAWTGFPSPDRSDIRGDLHHGARIFAVRPSRRLARAVFASLLWDEAAE